MKKEAALTQSEWILKEVNGLPLVFSPLLSRFSELRHAFSTRLGGETKPPMDSFNVGRLVSSSTCRVDLMKNRSKLCCALGLNPETLVVPDMSHSDVVLFVEEYRHARPKADGIATATKGLPVLLTFADCVPIIIFDPVKHVVAILHAGWRGTASNIAAQGVRLLSKHGSRVDNLAAAIGPAIGSCCYPTGLEAASQLLASLVEGHALNGDPQALMSTIKKGSLEEFFLIKDDRFHPDLKAINALQLFKAGVKHVDVTNLCTSCKPDLFYSHRFSEGKAGRQAAVACLN